jgi:hypothetical protein
MEFRWIGLIALWTLLSGPIFQSANSNRAHQVPAAAPVVRPATTWDK